MKKELLILIMTISSIGYGQVTGPFKATIGQRCTYNAVSMALAEGWFVDGGRIISTGFLSVIVQWESSGTGIVYISNIDLPVISVDKSLQVEVYSDGWETSSTKEEVFAINQKVGIGTRTPSQKLHVLGDSYLQGKIFVGNTDTYLYRDVANRIKTDDMFYVGEASPATYLYSTDTYLGNTSNDKIHLRGNIFDWSSGGGGIINASGNVGIGTITPAYKLHVAGDIYASAGWFRSGGQTGLYSQSYGTYFQAIDANYWKIRSDRGVQFYNRDNTKLMGYVYHDNANSFGLLDGDGNWSVQCTKDTDIKFYVNNGEKMRIGVNGNVAIGSTDMASGYKFSVKGKVRADEVTVYTDWADYVFAPEFTLKTLDEVEKFIKENKHLPDVPPAIQVEEDGVSLGEMNKILLQKIEEIMLYVIEQNNQIQNMQKEINELKK